MAGQRCVGLYLPTHYMLTLSLYKAGAVSRYATGWRHATTAFYWVTLMCSVGVALRYLGD